MGAAFVLSAAVCARTGVVAWRRRSSTPAATALAAAMAGLTWWSACNAVVQLAAAPLVQSTAVRCSLLGVWVVVTALHLLCRTLVDPHVRLRPATRWVLAAVPSLLAATLVADAAGAGTAWYTRLAPVDGRMSFAFGPLFWVHSAYCYTVLAGGLAVLVRAWWSAAAALRPQFTAVLLSALVPVAGNLVTVARPDLVGGQDVTPLLFAVTGLLCARAVLHRGLLQVVPVARHVVVDTIADGVLVVDAAGHVVDANPAARELARRVRPDVEADLVGLAADRVLGPDQLGDLPGGASRRTVEARPGLHLDVRTTLVSDRRGRSLGRVVVVRDVSEAVGATTRLREQLAEIDRLRAQLAEESVRDPLTGLHNRRFLDGALAAALREAQDTGRPVALLVIDVDHFKRVNDTHGHPVGDAVLVAVAGALRACARSGDVVARFGGEEFVLVLPGVPAPAARERAEDVRRRCAALEVPVAAAPAEAVRPTVSVGVAVHDAAAAGDAAALLAAADRALYAAKAAGRDRVRVDAAVASAS